MLLVVKKMKRSEVQREKLSPMMQQYMEIKDKYEDCIIFFRLGDFYEMFFEDAIIASRVLELTLTGKQAGLEERVPMCGVPHHAYAGYVDELIEKGYKVAICEQLEDPKLTKGMVKRDVIQVVTKGTRIDENIDSKSNNYIANIYSFDYCYGISFADISTGEVYATLVEGEKDKVIKEIVKHGFKEVIVNDNTDREIIEVLRSNYNILVTITKEESEDRNYEYIYEDIEDIRYISTLKHLLYYILDTKKGDLHHLQRCKIIKNSEYLEFDNNTKRNLELTETLRNRERQYSLLWLLDKNKTAMGSRYLKYNIENPLTSKQAIERRYDMVEKLSTEFILRDDLTKELSNVYDLERLAGRISYGNLNAKDLLQLKSSLHSFPKIKEILEELKYDKKLETMDELYQLLDKTILEDAPFTLHEGHLIKPGYNNELDELKKISSGSKDFILELEQKEKERTGIKNLKVGFNKVFGYYIEVSKGQKHLIKEEFGYDRKQTLANCERYTTPLLKEKENIILGAEEKIINLEYKLFMDIRNKKHMVYFIGNGGSAGIASHMTVDFLKNGRMRTHSMLDSSVITCLGNDYGYEYVFSEQLRITAQAGDLLVAISSSGNSPNIVNGIQMAKEKGCSIITLSGFRADHKISAVGDYNIHVPSMEYGIVESLHQMILQQIVDEIKYIDEGNVKA